jgi:hypothetical protein
MDYLIECVCRHDLTRHDETGCRGNDSFCPCMRTKLEALDGAIEAARGSFWASSHQSPSGAFEKTRDRTAAVGKS